MQGYTKDGSLKVYDGSNDLSIGSEILGGTEGSILFIGAGGLIAEDNANLFFDDANNRVGLGTNSPDGRLHLDQGIISSDIPAIKIEADWDNGATEFTLIDADVANTSSDTASKLVNLKVAGTPQYSLDRLGNVVQTGGVVAKNGTAGSPTYAFASSPSTGIRYNGGLIQMTLAGVDTWSFSGIGAFTAPNTGTLIYGSRLVMTSPGSGIVRFTDFAGSDFGRMAFGGSGSGYPAIKRQGAGLDIRLADDSDFGVLRSESLRVQIGSAGTLAILFNDEVLSGEPLFNTGLFLDAANSYALTMGFSGSAVHAFLGTGDYQIKQDTAKITFGSSGDAGVARIAANTIGMRQALNAQEFRIYGTWTNDSNTEYLALKHNGSASGIEITSVGLGTGTIRNFLFEGDGIYLKLPVKTDTGDPSGVEGAIYYNAFDGKFRGYEGVAWADLVGGGGGGGTPGGATGNVQYNNAGAFGGEAALYWDAANDWLGIGKTPASPLHVAASGSFVATFEDTGATALGRIEKYSVGCRLSHNISPGDTLDDTGAGAVRLDLNSDTIQFLRYTAGAGVRTSIPMMILSGAAAKVSFGYAGVPPHSMLINGESDNTLVLSDAYATTADKTVSITGEHRTFSEEKVCMIRMTNDASDNFIEIGGGSANLNAATEVSFYTGSTAATTTGTKRWLIDSNGDLLPNSDNAYDIGADAARAQALFSNNGTIHELEVDPPDNTRFIEFDGNSAANTTACISTNSTPGSVQGWLQITVNGTKRWIPFYDDPS